jgi:PAS domain S-box-containing protein
MPETGNKSKEQESAEAEVESFRADLGPFVIAAETTRMAMVFMDAKEPDNPIIFANDAFLSLTGYDRKEVLGQGFNFLVADTADAEALAQIEAGFESDSDRSLEIRYRRKDGSEFWAALFVSPVRDRRDSVVQHFASYVDLTKHKEEQAQSRMLIDELNHRVKNTLSTVQSLVRQALRTTSDPNELRKSIESRLFALSRSHDLLTRVNWKNAGLLDVLTDALAPFMVADDGMMRITMDGKNVPIPPKVTLALGVAFHELATNAVKYGALSDGVGSVLLAWTIEAAPKGPRIVMQWQEKDGPPVKSPSRKGFGSRLIENGLANDLEGTVNLDYRADGVVCAIDFPVPRGS